MKGFFVFQVSVRIKFLTRILNCEHMKLSNTKLLDIISACAGVA